MFQVVSGLGCVLKNIIGTDHDLVAKKKTSKKKKAKKNKKEIV